MNDPRAGEELIAAGRVLARAGLVDAFGHVSTRSSAATARITPARPLGALASEDELLELPLSDLDALPAGVPAEGWIHWAAYRRTPTTRAVCRAQPPSPLALAAVARALPAFHGQGALVAASVPVFDDARLVRDRARGEALADMLDSSHAVIMRGNGAVTTGSTVGEAVTRMVLLERSAQLFLAARPAGSLRPLRDDEVAAWEAAAPELLERLWRFLRDDVDAARPAG